MKYPQLQPFYSLIKEEIDKFFFLENIPSDEHAEYFEEAGVALTKLFNKKKHLTPKEISTAVNKVLHNYKQETNNHPLVIHENTFYNYQIRHIQCGKVDEHFLFDFTIQDNARQIMQISGTFFDGFFYDVWLHKIHPSDKSYTTDEKIDILDELLVQSMKENLLDSYLTHKDLQKLVAYIEWLPQKKHSAFISITIDEVDLFDYKPIIYLKVQFANSFPYPLRKYYIAEILYDKNKNEFSSNSLMSEDDYIIRQTLNQAQLIEIQQFLFQHFQLKQRHLLNREVYLIFEDENHYQKGILREVENGLPYLIIDEKEIFFFEESLLFETEEAVTTKLSAFKQKEMKRITTDNYWISALFSSWKDETNPTPFQEQAMIELIQERIVHSFGNNKE